MGYGARPHDWELDELESMNSVSLSLLVYVTQPIVADQPRRAPTTVPNSTYHRFIPSCDQGLLAHRLGGICRQIDEAAVILRILR
jgi:hypothetical protein